MASSTSAVSPEFLDSLTTLFPASSRRQNPYSYIAAIVLAANNRFSDVAAVYKHSLAQNSSTSADETTLRLREALFKTNVLYGTPRMINSLLELSAAMPAALRGSELQNKALRNHDVDVAALTKKGERLFRETYGENAETTVETLKLVHSDFIYFCMTLVYGPLYGYDGVLSEAETSFAMIAALVGIECSLQIKWHIDGALRHGASKEEVKAVRDIAVKVLERLGKDTTDVPDVV